jgi:hypothetical protein
MRHVGKSIVAATDGDLFAGRRDYRKVSRISFLFLGEVCEQYYIVECAGRSLYAYELRRVVVDDFYEDPEKVRRWALAADYYRPRDETIWRTRAKLFAENTKERHARC